MLSTWFIIFLANHRGIDSMKYAFCITFPVSVTLVVILCVTGLRMGCGVSAGITEYIDGPLGEERSTLDVLKTSTVWTDALL